jgi:hypothetical protein
MTLSADPYPGNPQRPQTPFVRFLYSQPMWRRRIFVVLFLAAALAWPAMYGWRVGTAERVTINVTHCPDKPPAKGEGCGGTWTLPDGTRGHGVIDGYAPTGGDGVTVAGWATAGRATTDLVLWWIPAIIGLGSIGGGILVFVVLWPFLLLRHKRRAQR